MHIHMLDRWRFWGENDGNFSVRLAYNILHKNYVRGNFIL